VVQRYDRVNVVGNIVGLHQIDGCQLLGHGAGWKYQRQGSLASIPKLVEALRDLPVRAVDLLQVQRWVMFNYLIGNADAHAKNLSVLVDDKGYRLAPFYDLLCVKAYGDDGLAQGAETYRFKDPANPGRAGPAEAHDTGTGTSHRQCTVHDWRQYVVARIEGRSSEPAITIGWSRSDQAGKPKGGTPVAASADVAVGKSFEDALQSPILCGHKSSRQRKRSFITLGYPAHPAG
jgi:hypothetical protein